MTIRRRTTCRDCGTELTSRTSLMYGHGTACITKLTPAQKAAALKLTQQENDPGYVPPGKAASIEAGWTNAAARRTVEEAQAPDTCHHDGIKGECPQCVQENDLGWCVRQVIKAIRADRERGIPHRPSQPWPSYAHYAGRPAAPKRRDSGQLVLEAS